MLSENHLEKFWLCRDLSTVTKYYKTYDAVFAINTVVTQPSFPGAFLSSSHQVRGGYKET